MATGDPRATKSIGLPSFNETWSEIESRSGICGGMVGESWSSGNARSAKYLVLEIGFNASYQKLTLRDNCTELANSTMPASPPGLHRVCLGGGVRGMVRYLRKEVEQFEQSRLA